MPLARTFVRAGVAVAAAVAALAPASAAGAATLPADFHESTVFGGLSEPGAVRFATFPDTRGFVAQKDGKLPLFSDLSDTTPTQVADLGTNVQDYGNRGLLGMAVDPSFPARPYVYVLYTHDALIGGTAPRFGDTCPTSDNCVVSGRLSRLTINTVTNTMSAETPLINDWCQ